MEKVTAVFSKLQTQREEILPAECNTSLWWKTARVSPESSLLCCRRGQREKVKQKTEDIITQDGVNTNRELSPQNQDGLPSFPVEK